MAANGRLILADERLPFTPAQFGLLDTATDLATLEPHWQMGLTWEPNCADASATYAQCLVVAPGSPPTEPGPAEDPDPKTPTVVHLVRAAVPFTVYALHQCSAPGGWARTRKRAADALTRAEDRIVEQVFWTGKAGPAVDVVYPHLAADAELIEPVAGGATLQEAATVITADAAGPGLGTPLSPVDALSELEGAIGACYDGVATIHAPRKLIPRLAAQGVVKAQGGLLTTILGTKVAAGRGYPGTGPDGADTDGQTWMYATGEVFYRRGDIVQPTDQESFDRATNTVVSLAERTYVIGWDCCILATPVTISEGGAS